MGLYFHDLIKRKLVYMDSSWLSFFTDTAKQGTLVIKQDNLRNSNPSVNQIGRVLAAFDLLDCFVGTRTIEFLGITRCESKTWELGLRRNVIEIGFS